MEEVMASMKDFEIIVSEDIKNKSSETDREFLKSHKEEWRDALLVIVQTVSHKIKELDNEIHALRSTYSGFEIDPATGLDEQRTKANRFRFHAEKKLAEVDRLIGIGSETNEEGKLIDFLRQAIIAHRDWNKDKGIVNSEGDDYLYAALDGEWKF